MASIKRLVRPRLAAVLRRRFTSTSRRWEKAAVWELIRMVDDRDRTLTRAVLRELYDIEVGRHTYGAFRWDGSILAGARIGAFCSLAPGSRLGGVEHPLDRVAQHPFLWLANRGFVARDDERFESRSAPVVVEDDAFIGSRSMVVEGARVRRGAKLGAGAILTASTRVFEAETGTELERGVAPERAVCVGSTRVKSFPGGEFGMPCLLVLRRLAEDEIHDKTALNDVLREHGVGS